jgi:hypothetical protein
LHTRVGEAKPRCALHSDRNRSLHVLERSFADKAVVADVLDVEEMSVFCNADLAQFGEVFKAFANTKITRIFDRRFGSLCLQQLAILLDTRLLVVDMPRRRQ